MHVMYDLVLGYVSRTNQLNISYVVLASNHNRTCVAGSNTVIRYVRFYNLLFTSRLILDHYALCLSYHSNINYNDSVYICYVSLEHNDG